MEVKFSKGKCVFEGDDGVKFGTVKGTAKWAHILKANEFGNFGIDVYGEGVEDLIPTLEDMRDTAYDLVVAEGKKASKAEVYKQDDEGNKFIQFKLPELDFEGKPNKIKVYDVHGELVEDWDKLIGNGSKVAVRYRAKPYYMSSTKMVGISYRFYAVQVIDLEEYSAGGSIFDDESDGTTPFESDTDTDY